MKERLFNEIKLIFSNSLQGDKGRALYLDMCKGLAIILVVLGHRAYINDPIHKWLSSFHLPIFFIVSGLLFEAKKEYELSFKVFIKRKLTTIGIPYLVFSLATCVFVLVSGFDKATIYSVLQPTIMLQGNSVLWFLPVLFFSEILLFFSKKIRFSFIPFIITVVLSFYVFNIYTERLYYPYSLVKLTGNFYTSEAVYAWLPEFGKILIALNFMFAATFLYRFLDNKKFKITELLLGIALCLVNIFVAPRYSLFNLNYLLIENLYIYYALGLTGSFGIILLFKNLPNIPIISYFGRNSLIIMCTHINLPIMFWGSYLAMPIVARLNPESLFLLSLFCVGFTLALELILIVILNVYLPFLIGRKK